MILFWERSKRELRVAFAATIVSAATKMFNRYPVKTKNRHIVNVMCCNEHCTNFQELYGLIYKVYMSLTTNQQYQCLHLL